MNKLGLRLRELRKGKGSLLRQVASFMEVDTAVISKFESGSKRPSEIQVGRLADYYNVDKDQLLKLWLCDLVLETVKDKSQALDALHLAELELRKK